MRSFVQLGAQVKLDLMAEEAAAIMTDQSATAKSKEQAHLKNKNQHGQRQFEKQKSKDMGQLGLDSMVMERVNAESAAVARQQMRV